MRFDECLCRRRLSALRKKLAFAMDRRFIEAAEIRRSTVME
jgi:hypothetical protein